MVEQFENATIGANTDGGERATREMPIMLNVRSVATLLGCSTRHVSRLSDAGRMPRPVKLGALVRWSAAGVMAWIEAGCPSCRNGGGR